MTADAEAPRAIAWTIAGWAEERRHGGEDEIRAAREAVENLSAQLRAAVRTLHDARAREREIQDLTPCDIERDAAAIGQIPGVAGVTVRNGVVVVTTERVTIEHRGAVHDMGTFRLELSPDLGVRVFAAEPPPDVRVAWIHPHVQADRPCLGNARVGIEKLLGELQLVSTTEVLLRFLAAYDPETAYCDLSAWPTHP